ncbi:hypothetical protein HMPREF9374_0238 [Desmospora sp. 8437]|nr:hypothetical protein HMPREF9374_0238 [Desmospora sp. 8437]
MIHVGLSSTCAKQEREKDQPRKYEYPRFLRDGFQAEKDCNRLQRRKK